MSQQRWGTTRVPSGVLAAIGGAALAVWLFGVPLGTCWSASSLSVPS